MKPLAQPAFIPSPLVMLKLGGSLITDKTQPFTPRLDVLRRLAAEVGAALQARPALRLLIGHGSGSFGHVAGQVYGTRNGVRSAEEWFGYAQVSAAAARLNRLVTDAFLEAGVPALSLQPSASAHCHKGALQSIALAPIRAALAHGLVPLVYGDVALDDVRGGTIISTEEILAYLAPLLQPERILLVGEVTGVLDQAGDVVPEIRPSEFETLVAGLGSSHGVDVTGGMLSKVKAMLELVALQPQLSVRIFSGRAAGQVQSALVNPAFSAGTLLLA